MSFTSKELKVLRNIIGAVETGGQVYGEGDYADFTPAYANSYSEHGITIGRYQYYATEAKELLFRILRTYPEEFRKLDTAEIESDLKVRNWAYYKIAKGSEKAKCIQRIISSDVGKKVQDELVDEEMQSYAKQIERIGVTDHQAQAMCCNFTHQGGLSATKRIIAKTKEPYNLDNLYNASKTDTGNQVGAYKSRQKFVYNALKKYWPMDGAKYDSKLLGDMKVTNAESLYFRKDAGKTNDVVGVLNGGTIVKCDGYYKVVDGTKWYSIIYGVKCGYASSKYLTKV